MTDPLRAWVVRANVLAIICLTFLLYGVMCALILQELDVPDVLVAAASALSGALITLLVNTKPTPEVPVPLPVTDSDEGAISWDLVASIVVAALILWLLFAVLPARF